MVQKTNFNYESKKTDTIKSDLEIEEDRKNKLFVDGMLKRMSQKKYI